MRPSAEIERLRSLGHILDTKFTGPYGIRFGFDALIGLIPVVGDVTTAGVSFYIIYCAYQMNAPVPVLARMVVNVLIENIVSIIPFLGNLFDFYWKSNKKNVALLEEYLVNPGPTKNKSTAFLVLLVFIFIGIVVGCFTLAYWIAESLWNLLSSL